MNDDCQLSVHRFGGRPGGRLVFGLASLTSLMSRCSALLTCSFHAFLLLLTNFITSCKLHRSRMSIFFIRCNGNKLRILTTFRMKPKMKNRYVPKEYQPLSIGNAVGLCFLRGGEQQFCI